MPHVRTPLAEPRRAQLARLPGARAAHGRDAVGGVTVEAAVGACGRPPRNSHSRSPRSIRPARHPRRRRRRRLMARPPPSRHRQSRRPCCRRPISISLSRRRPTGHESWLMASPAAGDTDHDSESRRGRAASARRARWLPQRRNQRSSRRPALDLRARGPAARQVMRTRRVAASIALLIVTLQWPAAMARGQSRHPVSGRVLAPTMGVEGAAWLDRPEREAEEAPSKAIAALRDRAGCGGGGCRRRLGLLHRAAVAGRSARRAASSRRTCSRGCWI